MKKNRFRISGKRVTKNISPRLDKVIKIIEKDLQLKENSQFGRKAQKVSYQYASEVLAKMLEGAIK